VRRGLDPQKGQRGHFRRGKQRGEDNFICKKLTTERNVSDMIEGHKNIEEEKAYYEGGRGPFSLGGRRV